MGELIHFPGVDSRLYRQLIRARDEMMQIRIDLRFVAVNVAAAGVWREWSDSMPDGAVVEISDEALFECGDRIVVELARLDQATHRVLDQIEAELERCETFRDS